MARRTYTGRILAHHQALLADSMQQRGVAGGVWDVDAAGEHRNGEPVGGQGRAVRGPVDSVCAARHHRHVPFDQTGGQVRRDVLPVRGGRPRPDDRDGALGHLVEAGVADGPQRQRRMGLRPQPMINTGKCCEGKKRPLRIVGEIRRPPRRASNSRSSAALSIPRRASVRRASSSATSPDLTRCAASTGPTRRTSVASSGHGGSATRDKYASARRVSSVIAHRPRPGSSVRW